MDKLIEIADRAVADYGFRQAVLYGADDVARRWALSDQEKSVLESTVLQRLGALPIPVQPEDVPGEQARLAQMIRKDAQG
ncbi:MAG: hypothetical protein BZY87_02180 [SAR202 cluster bacterium Io17-Chloro-G6]|nr:MAG: hypothetical protein BZY87_02180 [SAR202 cluster bacterium Io17-Chloro-G6]